MAFHFIMRFSPGENLPFPSSDFQADARRSEGNLKRVSEGSKGRIAAENPKAAAEERARLPALWKMLFIYISLHTRKARILASLFLPLFFHKQYFYSHAPHGHDILYSFSGTDLFSLPFVYVYFNSAHFSAVI